LHYYPGQVEDQEQFSKSIGEIMNNDNSKVVEMFSVREINSLDNYERLFHTKNYIRRRSDNFKDSKNNLKTIRKMMKNAGYNNLVKFRKHRGDWDNLKGKIPIGYLDYIGAEKEQTLILTEVNKLRGQNE